ncbi:MAG: hypothetical protein NUV65_06720 [Candidatus Roizmanbacteria bacterium]|nr:hypothetical protein [Candidatus Roizmanbacteria bacterium]
MAWSEAQIRYAKSEKGQIARKKYQSGEKAKEAHRRYMLKRKARLAEAKQKVEVPPVQEVKEVVKIKKSTSINSSK